MASLETEILRFLNEPSEDKFEPLALAVFEYQRRQNPVYASYCEFLGTPQQVGSWKSIPSVPQQAFKRSELRSFAIEQTRAEFRTSGTMGEGYGKHFFQSLRLYEAAVQRSWDFFRLPRHNFVALMQHPDDAPFPRFAEWEASWPILSGSAFLSPGMDVLNSTGSRTGSQTVESPSRCSARRWRS